MIQVWQDIHQREWTDYVQPALVACERVGIIKPERHYLGWLRDELRIMFVVGRGAPQLNDDEKHILKMLAGPHTLAIFKAIKAKHESISHE